MKGGDELAENKKFYWIKLKTDFFNQETIDFLMSQPNGCQYVVLYQMLCLKTANNGGTLATSIGEMIVPYDVSKIVRDTKYFDFDTVTIALGLFKQLGLIYEGNENILKISNFDSMVGFESQWAEKKRAYREKKRQLTEKVEDNKKDIQEDNVRQEIRVRDKSLEIREKSIDNRDKSSEVRDRNITNNKDEFFRIVNLFNSICLSLTPIKSITDERIRKIFLIQQQYGYDFDFEKFFKRVEKSDFLTGRNGRWYTSGEKQANFDWIMKLDNISKIQNGIYDNKENSNGRNSSISDEDLEYLSNLGTNL